MKSHVQVAVIGGGVVGASVLYHLTKAGWKDVVLIERSELTSGSTWHAAGGMHTINGDPNVAKLQQYTINLYKEIEELSGQSCGVHLTGGIMLAGTKERLDWLKMVSARGRYLGMELDMVSVDEAAKLFPLMDKKHFVGALYDPIEGHVDPSGVTSRLRQVGPAAGRRGLSPHPRHRSQAAPRRHLGRRHREGQPSTPSMSSMPAACGRARSAAWSASNCRSWPWSINTSSPRRSPRSPHRPRRCCTSSTSRARSTCARRASGMLMGTYERRRALVGARDAVGFRPRAAAQRSRSHRAQPRDRFPAFPGDRAGRHQEDRSTGRSPSRPTAIPLIGPIRGLKNFWVACGVMAGFSQGGGVGLALANWMVNGDPGFDVWAMDVARFGDWATHGLHQRQGARELFAPLPHPLSQRGTAGRTAAAHDADLRSAQGCECRVRRLLGARARALVRAQGHAAGRGHHASTAPMPTPTSPRNARRCARPSACIEISNYGKFEVSGPGAEEWLTRLMANRMPRHRAHRALADAEPARQADRRFHRRPAGRGAVLHRRLRTPPRSYYHALVRAPSATTRRFGPGLRRRYCRALHRRAEVARLAASPGPRRSVDRGVSVPVLSADGCRHDPGDGRADHRSPAISATRSG